jgi:hypothetical protein
VALDFRAVQLGEDAVDVLARATSTKECRSRTSTVPTTFAGQSGFAGDGIHEINGVTPCSAPTLIQSRVWSAGVARLSFGFGAAPARVWA